MAPLVPFGHQMQKEVCCLTALSQTPFSGECLKGPTEVPSSPKRTPPFLSHCVQASGTTHNRRKFIISCNRNLPCWGSCFCETREGGSCCLPCGKLEGNEGELQVEGRIELSPRALTSHVTLDKLLTISVPRLQNGQNSAASEGRHPYEMVHESRSFIVHNSPGRESQMSMK